MIHNLFTDSKTDLATLCNLKEQTDSDIRDFSNYTDKVLGLNVNQSHYYSQ